MPSLCELKVAASIAVHPPKSHAQHGNQYLHCWKSPWTILSLSLCQFDMGILEQILLYFFVAFFFSVGAFCFLSSSLENDTEPCWHPQLWGTMLWSCSWPNGWDVQLPSRLEHFECDSSDVWNSVFNGDGWGFQCAESWRVNSYVFALIDTRQWVSMWFSNLKRTCSFFCTILACHWVFHVRQHTVEDLELFREAVSCTSSELSLPTADIRIMGEFKLRLLPQVFYAKWCFSKESSVSLFVI